MEKQYTEDKFKEKKQNYIVLLGDVGAGKSTLVEKVTGEKDRSSARDESVTRSSQIFYSSDESFIISDTPGTNSISDKLEHNIHIAHALNYCPVSCILIVVQGHVRLDNTIDQIRRYAERFVDLYEMLGVFVSHMDQVNWEKKKFLKLLNDELGLTDVVFSGLDTPGETLIRDLKKMCRKPTDLSITSDNFLKYFKVNDNHVKIMKCVKDEVHRFTMIYKNYSGEIKKLKTSEDQADCMFEFQAWMFDEIIEAQKRVSEENGFTFDGENMANEAGHIANMTNQLRNVLNAVRLSTLAFQDGHGISSLRQCPHCGLVWAKVEGCDGNTHCGERVEEKKFDSRSNGVMATFSFKFKDGKLLIKRTGEKKAKRVWGSAGQKQAIGCGSTIAWRDMKPVEVPPDLITESYPEIGTDDVKLIPKKAAESWSETYQNTMESIGTLTLPTRKSGSYNPINLCF